MERLAFVWDVRGYFFWLLVVSTACFLAERLFAWRRQQRAGRPQILQDLFFLVFNGHLFGVLIAGLSTVVAERANDLIVAAGLPRPDALRLLAPLPLAVQFILLWVLMDFVEWCIHNLLHRVPWLWQFHKLHHSILEMDFIGNFRFHWMESIIYGTLRWLPLAMLGVVPEVLLPLAVVTTLIGHLNHSNVPLTYGPLRYVFNSPRMHIWHHDVVRHQPAGQNFGITLSIFDWILGTAYWPTEPEQPERLGFAGDERYPRGLFSRLLYPLSALWVGRRSRL